MPVVEEWRYQARIGKRRGMLEDLAMMRTTFTAKQGVQRKNT